MGTVQSPQVIWPECFVSPSQTPRSATRPRKIHACGWCQGTCLNKSHMESPQKKLACLKGVVFWWDDFWLGICWIFLGLVWTWHKYKSLDKSSHWPTKLQRFLRWFRLATLLRKYIFLIVYPTEECRVFWILNLHHVLCMRIYIYIIIHILMYPRSLLWIFKFLLVLSREWGNDP